MKCLPNIIKYN